MRVAPFPIHLAGCKADLIGDYRHHEEQVEAEGPEDEEFGAFEVTAGDGMLLGTGELIVFEGWGSFFLII